MYQTKYLEMIARHARMALTLGNAQTTDAALDFSLGFMEQECSQIIAGRRPSMTAEQVDEYRELADVVRDVRNGFVSPTIGNVREYAMARIDQCGDKREGYTCTLAPHEAGIDHAEQRRTPGGIPYTVAFWNYGSGITGLDRVVVCS